MVKAVEAEQLAGPEVLKMVGECADAIHAECVEKSPCAGCGCLVDSSDLEKLEFGCTALKTLVVGATAKRSMEEKLELARSCCWGGVGGRRMFGTGGDIYPFTITRHGADRLYLDPAGCTGGVAQLCSRCRKSCSECVEGKDTFKWPNRMVVGGSDFGQPERLGLRTDSSMAEKVVISRVRVFDAIIKLRADESGGLASMGALKGHAVSFEHDAPSGHRLSGEFVRCDQDNDVDKITATLDAQLAPLNIRVEMPPQEEVKMEFHFIKTPSFLPASTQWVVLGDMWAINDYQFMSERVAYLQDVQIQGKKTKSLWHVHQKYMSKQSIVEGPTKALMSKLKDKKNCKVVVIKPTTKAN